MLGRGTLRPKFFEPRTARELAAARAPCWEAHTPTRADPVHFMSMRLDPDDERSVRRFSDALCTIRIGRSSTWQEVSGELRRWLGFDRFLVYAPAFAVDHLELEVVASDGFSKLALGEFGVMLATSPFRFGYYDPLRPEPWQRDRVWRMSDLGRKMGPPTKSLQDLHRRMGVAEMDQLRSLVCEGRTLLAWFGGLARREFTARDKARLAALIPAARSRLAVDRHVARGSATEAALAVAMETIPAPALVVGKQGRPLLANSAGRELFEAERAAVTGQLQAALRARKKCSTDDTGCIALTRLDVHGAGEHWLAVFPREPRDPARLRAAAMRRWPLTERQLDVLQLLARGLTNRAISITLGCAEGTAELHVSAVLARMGAESRAEAVAKFWTEL